MLREKSGAITLHAKGRDMEGYSHAISFDKSACRWEIIGRADDYSLGDTQRMILDYLRQQTASLTIREISGALSMKHATVKSSVNRMAKKGALISPIKGQYLAPQTGEF